MKTLEYPMIARTMDKAQWDFIMAPLLTAALPRMGYVRKLPHDLVYAPLEGCSLGVFHPWHNQHFLSQLKVVLQETTLPSITGDLIRASLEQLRLEIGLSGCTDQWQWSVMECLATDCWLKDLLHYSARHDLYVKDTLPTLCSYRAQDKFLMECFIASGYRKKNLQTLNKCWKVLQVTTLAEITSADGLYVELWAWKGKPKETSLNSYQWLQTPPLQPRHWRQWQQALQATFLHLSQSNKKKLCQPLGAWDTDVTIQWQWFYLATEERIYHCSRSGWQVFSKMPSRVQRLRSLRFLHTDLAEDSLPHDAVMATISCTSQGVKLTGAAVPTAQVTTPPETLPTSLLEALEAEAKADQWDVNSLHVIDNGRALAAAILRGDAKAVSNGSFKNTKGSFLLQSKGS
jgi:hypothetical protein